MIEVGVQSRNLLGCCEGFLGKRKLGGTREVAESSGTRLLNLEVVPWGHCDSFVPNKVGRSGWASGRGGIHSMGADAVPDQEVLLQRAELGWGQHFHFDHVMCEMPI